MKDSLAEPGHLPRGVGVVVRYEVLVPGGCGEGGFIIEKVNERVFGKSIVFLDRPEAGEWIRSGGRKEGDDAGLERPGEHGRPGSK